MAITKLIFLLLPLLFKFNDIAEAQVDSNRPSLAQTFSNTLDVVGFSYSLASMRPRSRRFIHFLREHLRSNVDFLPAYGSVSIVRPGVYFFSFAFVGLPNERTIVSLRVNGTTAVSGISDRGSHVSQSTLLNLAQGDVVQLEIMEGKILEPHVADYAYTTFSGHLISALNNRVNVRRHDYIDSNECCCTRPCSPPSPLPPAPPSRTPPPYIVYPTPAPVPVPPFRTSSCCEFVRLWSSSALVQQVQQEKLGVFEMLSSDSDRLIYKHCDFNDIFLYYHIGPWSGWVVGPGLDGQSGGLIVASDPICVEKSDENHVWHYYDGQSFRPDPLFSVECHNGRDGGRQRSVDFDGVHLHHHFHHGEDEHLRPPGPAYEIRSNEEWVEAKFVFPNFNESHPINGFLPIEPAVIEARRERDDHHV